MTHTLRFRMATLLVSAVLVSIVLTAAVTMSSVAQPPAGQVSGANLETARAARPLLVMDLLGQPPLRLGQACDLSALVFLLIGSAGVLLSRRVLSPLLVLSQWAHAIREGSTAPPPATDDDELREISAAFGEFQDDGRRLRAEGERLRAALQAATEFGVKATQSADQVVQSVIQASEAAQRIGQATQHVARGAQGQSQATTMVSNTVKEMTASVEQLARGGALGFGCELTCRALGGALAQRLGGGAQARGTVEVLAQARQTRALHGRVGGASFEEAPRQGIDAFEGGPLVDATLAQLLEQALELPRALTQRRWIVLVHSTLAQLVLEGLQIFGRQQHRRRGGRGGLGGRRRRGVVQGGGGDQPHQRQHHDAEARGPPQGRGVHGIQTLDVQARVADRGLLKGAALLRRRGGEDPGVGHARGCVRGLVEALRGVERRASTKGRGEGGEHGRHQRHAQRPGQGALHRQMEADRPAQVEVSREQAERPQGHARTRDPHRQGQRRSQAQAPSHADDGAL